MAAGGVASAVRTSGDWAESAMGEAARTHPWIDFRTEEVSRSPRRRVGRSAAQRTPEDRPLQGIRVLDFTRFIADPSATRLLGSSGADVFSRRPTAATRTDGAAHRHRVLEAQRSGGPEGPWPAPASTGATRRHSRSSLGIPLQRVGRSSRRICLLQTGWRRLLCPGQQ
jgi:hypothetical protein